MNLVLESIDAGYIRAHIQGGEAEPYPPLELAIRVANEYKKPVTFDFGNDIWIVHPTGEVHRMIQGRWTLVSLTGEPIKQPEEPMSKSIAKVFVFASSSGSGTYETLLYTDGSTSCE